MILDAKLFESGHEITCDVCILGGGVAGITLANELRSQYNDIVLLESGGNGYDQSRQDLYQAEYVTPPFWNPHHSRMRFLGGSSNHWENNTSLFDRIDFEKRAWVDGSGWEIARSDLSPYYDSAARYCGTKTDNYSADKWAEILDKPLHTVIGGDVKTSISKFSSPPVRFFDAYGAELKDSQSVRVVVNANVMDAVYSQESGVVDRVLFESVPGRPASVKAKLFVMCFGGIENARMLLHFNRHNNQLGNSGDSVGRYFMDHPIAEAAYFFPNEKKDLSLYGFNKQPGFNVASYFDFSERFLKEKQLNNLRMPLIPGTNYLTSSAISSFHTVNKAISQGEIPDQFGKHLSNMLGDLDMLTEAISRKALDKRIFDHADQPAGYRIQAMLEQTPQRSNRISLGTEVDAFGIPKIRIDWALSQSDKDHVWRGLDYFANFVGANDLGRVRVNQESEGRIFGDQMAFGNHHMGTTRMSRSPHDGVVDKNLLVHGAKNFYIGGSSVFPTGSHVPPTLTITAMTLRLADHIKSLGV
ncbi:hypothetical protein A9Q99_20205 [Gammaproteobacteria bacterium 45_16_T64]|nr:hypothetical protein A9Q99_20205 [Gammaproteobacteria bacterium 45_16_T64]